MTTPTKPKLIHRACLQNLQQLLKGALTFGEWSQRQEELVSRLSPEPELPFTEEAEEPERPRAA